MHGAHHHHNKHHAQAIHKPKAMGTFARMDKYRPRTV